MLDLSGHVFKLYLLFLNDEKDFFYLFVTTAFVLDRGDINIRRVRGGWTIYEDQVVNIC